MGAKKLKAISVTGSGKVSLGDHLMEVAVLGGMMVVGVVVATRTFRWE